MDLTKIKEIVKTYLTEHTYNIEGQDGTIYDGLDNDIEPFVEDMFNLISGIYNKKPPEVSNKALAQAAADGFRHRLRLEDGRDITLEDIENMFLSGLELAEDIALAKKRQLDREGNKEQLDEG